MRKGATKPTQSDESIPPQSESMLRLSRRMTTLWPLKYQEAFGKLSWLEEACKLNI